MDTNRQDKKRHIEDTEELRRVIAELQAKVNAMEEEDEEEEVMEALASGQVTEESYVAFKGDEAFAEEDLVSDDVVEEEQVDSEEQVKESFEEDINDDIEQNFEEDRSQDEADLVLDEEPVRRKASKKIQRDEEVTKTKKKKSKKSKLNDDDTIISLENVSKSYVKGVPALDDVNLKIKKGEFVFIVGASGSGKSTLIRLLLRELKPTSGSIVVNGLKVDKLRQYQVPKLRRCMGVVFQDFRLLKDRNVYENVAFAQRIMQVPAREMKKNVPNMLAVVGLASKYRAKPDELSGGEQQRVALARALVNKPPILLADEPTGNLDRATAEEIMGLLEKINQNGTTVIVVTHDDKIVNDMQKRVVTIKNGIVISDEKKGGYMNEDY